MANYDTTADDFASSGGDGSMWENVDGADLLREGWQPGKKHTFGQNLLRVISMGGYNPDDRDASAINKKVLGQKGMNQEQINQFRRQEAAEIANDAAIMRRANPELSPEAAMMEAAQNRVSAMMAMAAEHEAESSESGLRTVKARAESPKAGDVIRGSQDATIAADATNKLRSDDMGQYYRGLKSLNYGSRRAGSEMESQDLRDLATRRAFNSTVDDAALDPDRNMLERQKITGANTVLNEEELLRQSTAQDRMRGARYGAQSAADQAGAAARVLSNPTTAERIYESGINKQFSLPVPTGTDVYAPLPVTGSTIPGREYSGGMRNYEVIKRDADNNIIGTQQRVVAPRGTVTPGGPGAVAPGSIISKEELQRWNIK